MSGPGGKQTYSRVAFKAIQGDLLPLAYAAALRFWTYPILIILAVATWRSQQRVRRENDAAPT